jgi:hypothetical protein
VLLIRSSFRLPDQILSSRDSHPVLTGWTIPGLDGWEVISVVEKKGGYLARAAARAK